MKDNEKTGMDIRRDRPAHEQQHTGVCVNDD